MLRVLFFLVVDFTAYRLFTEACVSERIFDAYMLSRDADRPARLLIAELL